MVLYMKKMECWHVIIIIKIIYEISIINNYTDIELDEENIVGDYDILCELGIVSIF